MNKIIKTYLLLTLLISCKEDILVENTCNVINPVSDLNWISTRIQDFEQGSNTTSQYFYLSQAMFNNETVFFFGNCCPFCSTITVVQNCDGQTIGVLGTDIDLIELKESIVIWKHPESTCN